MKINFFKKKLKNFIDTEPLNDKSKNSFLYI